MNNKQIGFRVSRTRTSRMLTQQQLVDRYNDLDVPKQLTVSILSAWERGVQVIPAYAMQPLAVAMECSIYALMYDEVTKLHEERMVYEMLALPLRQRKIVKYLFTKWSGDIIRWIEASYMYSQCTPAGRAKGTRGLLESYIIEGRPCCNNDLPVDTGTIIEGCRNLDKW